MLSLDPTLVRRAASTGVLAMSTAASAQYVETQKLIPPVSSGYWAPAAVDGDWAVLPGSESVQVLERTDEGWSEFAVLTPSTGEFEGFGGPIAISGTTIAVGATAAGLEWPDVNLGALYVFEFQAGAWVQTARILGLPDPQRDDGFGKRVGIAGDTIFAGAFHHERPGSLAIVQRVGSSWDITQVLHAPDPAPADIFPGGIAGYGDTVLVSSNDSPGGTDYRRAVHVLKQAGSLWSYHSTLPYPFGLGDDDWFGVSFDIGDGVAVVGALAVDGPGTPNRGSAFVYTHDGTAWVATHEVEPGAGQELSQFGHSVALDDGTLMVGANLEDETAPRQGAVYHFELIEDAWVEFGRLLASDPEDDDMFGTFIALSGPYALFTAPGDDDAGTNRGAIYVFGTGDVDTDGDGLYDSWETDGIPYLDADGAEQRYLLDWDQDGHSDANPQRKDLFVEVDAMEGTGIAPTMADLQAVIDAFDRAPVPNPGGIDGVALHIQLSDLNLPLQSFSDGFDEFDVLKEAWFGTAADLEGSPETVAARLDAKALAYRYCIFGLKHGSDGSSGLAELPGNDFMVTIGDWTPPGGTSRQKAATFMHELGHTLGLTHKGPKSQLSAEELAGPDQHFNLKPNYYSIMNYNWQMPRSWHTTGSHPLASLNSGYSAAPLRTLDEDVLVEGEGLVPASAEDTYPAPGFKVPHNVEADPTQPPDVKYAIIRIGGGVDWNGDGVVEDPPAFSARDVNRVRTDWPSSPDTTLHGYADWPHLIYDFSGLPTFDDGVHGDTEQEMTYAEHLALDDILPPNCDGDIDADGAVAIGDLLEMLAAWGPCTSGVVCVQDLDENGEVAVSDLLALLAAWGACP